MTAIEPEKPPPDAVMRAVAGLKMKRTGDQYGTGLTVIGKGQVKRIRERHHIVAKMIARGVKIPEVAECTGWSEHQLHLLVNQTPAFQELIIHYQKEDAEREVVLAEYTELLRKRLLMGEQLIHDRLNEEGDDLSVNELLRLVADAADRTGYSKQNVNLNVNLDFAAALEAARKRSGRQRSTSSPPAGAGDRGVLSADTALPRSAPLLELKAEPVPASSPAPLAESVVEAANPPRTTLKPSQPARPPPMIRRLPT